jgi:hypothetical protein
MDLDTLVFGLLNFSNFLIFLSIMIEKIKMDKVQ